MGHSHGNHRMAGTGKGENCEPRAVDCGKRRVDKAQVAQGIKDFYQEESRGKKGLEVAKG